MRVLAALLAIAASLAAGCSAVQPLADVSASLTTLPMPSGATVVPWVLGADDGSCDATASLRPSTAVGPAVDEIRRRGRLIVGVDQSTNLFSFRDPVSGELQGFDIDIAREVARDVVGDPNKVEFRLLTSADRVHALELQNVDIVVNAMTITCERAEHIAFSTVYFDANQRLLVPKDSPVRGADGLAGKRVCAQVDTTSLATINRVAPTATLVTVQNWDDCLVALQQGQVDAVSTDDRSWPEWPCRIPICISSGRAWRPSPTVSVSTRRRTIWFVRSMPAWSGSDATGRGYPCTASG